MQNDHLTAPNLQAIPVAMFPDAFGKEPKTADLAAILEATQSGRWRDAVEAIRATYSRVLTETGDTKSAKDAISEAKKKLPAFCISGTASSRTAPLEHSGYLQVDLDGLSNALDETREKMKADPHIAFGFVSPSGDGLKCGLRIDGNRHGDSFTAAQDYFREGYGLEIDPAVKDRLRLCFVSFDPDAWTNSAAEPLPLSDISEPPPSEYDGPAEPDDREPEEADSASPSILVLPSGSVSISQSARAMFRRIGPTRTLFFRGGKLAEAVEEDGITRLEILREEHFRSRVERHGLLFAWRSNSKGKPVLKQTKMSADDATAIMATHEARELLPPVASVLRCAVLVETSEGVAILGQGYHCEQGGLLIVAGKEPPRVELQKAVASLRWLVEEVHFQSEGDRSRALAAFITPALRMGGHLKGNIPIDVAEADKSQSGKGYRHSMVCALYGETSYLVTSRKGGVGSADESFAAALVAGRSFVCLDNVRGKLDSQHLEAFLTSSGLFPARIPHRGEIMVNPRRFILQMSSNGMEATRDLANRSSICRIRKREGYAYRDTLGELENRQPFFLGCVFAVITEWLACGRPRTTDTRHDFREWCQTLDWICQKILGCAPLMDGHEQAQERVSNPGLSWLRLVALAVEGENRLGLPLIASELVEVCELHGVEIPGKPADDDRAKRQVGTLCKQLFREGDALTVDGFTVARAVRFQSREGGGAVDVKTYTFAKV